MLPRLGDGHNQESRLTPETLAILARMRPGKFVWCQHGKPPGSKMDEHQVCLDMEADHRKKGGTTWSCTCNCHR